MGNRCMPQQSWNICNIMPYTYIYAPIHTVLHWNKPPHTKLRQHSTHPKAIKGIKAPLCSFTDSDAWRKCKMYKTFKVHVLSVSITSILMGENEDNSCSFQEITERFCLRGSAWYAWHSKATHYLNTSQFFWVKGSKETLILRVPGFS